VNKENPIINKIGENVLHNQEEIKTAQKAQQIAEIISGSNNNSALSMSK